MVPASPLAVSDFEVLEADDGPAFDGVAAEGDRGFAVALGATAAGTTGAFVSADYFRILGTPPHLGRLLVPSDHEPGAPPVAVIGFHLWRDRFGEPADIVGRSLSVGGRDVTIVGVAPPRFTGVQPSDVGTSPVDYVQLWLPLRLTSIWPGSPSRDHPWLTVMGRLTPGFTHKTAAPSLSVAASRLSALHPDKRKQAAFLVKPHGFGPDDAPLQVLLIVALFLAVPLSVLAIACANVASLQLARVIDRSRELAVRLALGASRGQLLRLLTLDAVMLALLATSAGWLGAAVALGAARDVFPLTITLDRHVVLFALTLAAGVVVLTGLAPAWLVLRRSTAAGLKQTAQSGGTTHSRLRHGLVGAADRRLTGSALGERPAGAIDQHTARRCPGSARRATGRVDRSRPACDDSAGDPAVCRWPARPPAQRPTRAHRRAGLRAKRALPSARPGTGRMAICARECTSPPTGSRQVTFRWSPAASSSRPQTRWRPSSRLGWRARSLRRLGARPGDRSRHAARSWSWSRIP